MALLTLLSCSWWLSPAVAWFIFVNAVVGAIAFMSTSCGTQAVPQQAAGGPGAASQLQRRLCRSGSSVVLDRLRFFFVFPAEQLPIVDDESSAAAPASQHCCSRQAGAASVSVSSTQLRAPKRNAPGETVAISAAQPSTPLAMATVEDRAPPEPPTEEEEEEEDKAEAEAEKEEKDHDECISLHEAYALAQLHRARPLLAPPPAAAAAAAATATAPAALPTTTDDKRMVADRRRVLKAGEAALEGKAELNARAELFIRQFREDLRLQRLNSILKHTHALGSPSPTVAR